MIDPSPKLAFGDSVTECEKMGRGKTNKRNYKQGRAREIIIAMVLKIKTTKKKGKTKKFY